MFSIIFKMPGSKPLQIRKIEGHSCTIDLRLEKLAMVPFFKDLSITQLQEINEKFRAAHFLKNEVIYRESEQARMLRVVVFGTVKLLKHTEAGKDIVLDILQPGDLFGSLSVLGDKIYPESAQAYSDVCNLSINSDDFYTILKKYSSVGIGVLNMTAERLQSAQQQIQELSTFSVEKRIANILLRLYKKFGENDNPNKLIQLPLSRMDLADMTGTSPETASRIMSHFKEEGIIKSGRQWVSILDEKKLSEITNL